MLEFLEPLIKIIPSGIIFTFLAWALQASYQRYNQEKLAISTFERILALNLTELNDNIEFMGMWEHALQNNATFSCSFAEMTIDDKSHFAIRDLGLVNKLLNANHMLSRTNKDLFNIYKDYREMISEYRNKRLDEAVFKVSNEYTRGVIKSMREGLSNFVMPAVTAAVAHLRVADKVNRHSIYGYLNIIVHSNIYPKVTKTKLENELQELNKLIQERK